MTKVSFVLAAGLIAFFPQASHSSDVWIDRCIDGAYKRGLGNSKTPQLCRCFYAQRGRFSPETIANFCYDQVYAEEIRRREEERQERRNELLKEVIKKYPNAPVYSP